MKKIIILLAMCSVLSVSYCYQMKLNKQKELRNETVSKEIIKFNTETGMEISKLNGYKKGICKIAGSPCMLEKVKKKRAELDLKLEKMKSNKASLFITREPDKRGDILDYQEINALGEIYFDGIDLDLSNLKQIDLEDIKGTEEYDRIKNFDFSDFNVVGLDKKGLYNYAVFKSPKGKYFDKYFEQVSEHNIKSITIPILTGGEDNYGFKTFSCETTYNSKKSFRLSCDHKNKVSVILFSKGLYFNIYKKIDYPDQSGFISNEGFSVFYNTKDENLNRLIFPNENI